MITYLLTYLLVIVMHAASFKHSLLSLDMDTDVCMYVVGYVKYVCPHLCG